MDIDELLVRAAWKRRRTVWSLQAPPDAQMGSDSSHTAAAFGKKRKRLEHTELEQPPPLPAPMDHFPASCEHMFGPLPIQLQTPDSASFPHNVTFRHADWVSTEIPEDAEGYDIVVA